MNVMKIRLIDISVKTQNVNFVVALEEKSYNHQSHTMHGNHGYMH